MAKTEDAAINQFHIMEPGFILKEKTLAPEGYPLSIQPLVDGLRAVFFGDKFYGPHDGKEITGAPYINEDLSNIGLFDDAKNSTKIDGFIYCHGLSYREIVEVLEHNRRVKVKEDLNYCLEFHVYDCMLEEVDYGVRRLVNMAFRSEFISSAPSFMVNNYDEAVEIKDNFKALGYPSALLKSGKNIYRQATSSSCFLLY